MRNENDFSFDKLGSSNSVSNSDSNADYLDLLDKTKVNKDEIDRNRDIYSNSSDLRNNKYFVDNNIYAKDDNDIYSDSSRDIYSSSKRSVHTQVNEPEDIYTLDDEKDEYEDVYSDSNAIFISKANTIKSTSRYEEREYEDIPLSRPIKPQNAPTRSAQMTMDDDEISDYELRRGKRVDAPKRKKKKSPVAKLVVIAILVLVIGFAGILFTGANGIVDNFTKGEEIEHIEDVASLTSSPDVKNILFIGADKEKGGASRSDSIMIISVNKAVGKVVVTSVLRDTHVDIPGECEAKINSAYAWGGANLLIQTIEQNFGLKIDGYAVVNFNMFTDLVDGLGGIDIEVTENEADYINNRHNYKSEKKPDYFESGEKVHLNGYQALWYARIRKLDSDFMRTYRQRKVIAAIAENVKTELVTGNIFGLISTAERVAPNIETSLTKSEFTSLLFSMISCVSKSGLDMEKLLVSQQLPFEDTWWFESKWDGSSIALNLSENRELLYNSIYEITVEEETEEDTKEATEE